MPKTKYTKSNIRWYVDGRWMPRWVSIVEEDKLGIKQVKTFIFWKNAGINSNIVKNIEVIVEGKRSSIKWLEEFLSAKQ